MFAGAKQTWNSQSRHVVRPHQDLIVLQCVGIAKGVKLAWTLTVATMPEVLLCLDACLDACLDVCLEMCPCNRTVGSTGLAKPSLGSKVQAAEADENSCRHKAFYSIRNS